jgi:hypothetical protein
VITKPDSLALVNSLIAERRGEILFVSEKRFPHEKLIRDSLQVRVRGAHGIFRDGGLGLGNRGENSRGAKLRALSFYFRLSLRHLGGCRHTRRRLKLSVRMHCHLSNKTQIP